MREDQTRRCCCCSVLKASTVRSGIAHPELLQKKRSVWLIRPSVCPSVCLSSALPTTTFCLLPLQTHHIWITSIMGFWGGGGDLRASFLSFFLSLRACVSKGYVKVLKYSGALVSAYLSLTLISACPCLLLTLGDAMTDERVHHTGICCCCCLCCCF
jgi:hypothetical protein